MIVVTEGTSAYGRLVVRHLLTRVPAGRVAVTTTDPEQAADLAALGVEVRQEDYADPGNGAAIFADAERVLSNPPPGWIGRQTPSGSIDRALARIEAVTEAGVPHLVHVGIINSERTYLKWHHALEGAVRRSGVPFTILRDNLHSEALLPAARLALASGEFVCAFGGRTMAPAALTDYAEAAAIVLADGGHEGEVLELSGFGLTALGIASVFTLLADREIALLEVSSASVAAALKNAGAADEVAEELSDLYEATSRGEFSQVGDDLDRILGHSHQLNEAALRAALAAG
ncbi:NAD(P)H-binding protein [Microbispora sp. NPDC046933]|uniref:NAD(P)H-binding protein n=1 Tax=Microbispora sp. NPDC046933 TaxID=3155618 RepID=UPI0033EF58F5